MGQDEKARAGSSPADSTIDSILAQWRRERPDIDSRPMAVCGAVWRASEHLRRGVLANWKRWGLDFPGSDVMLTLRRQGQGKTLSPSDLAKEMMLSTSAMTNRLDRLEKRGLVARTLDPNDRRGIRIQLTGAGFDLVEEMIVSHVETEERLISALSQSERTQLRTLLAKLGDD